MSERCKTYNILVLSISSIAIILSLFLTPSSYLLGTHTQLHLPPCIFYTIFHRKCPLCGLTTSFAFIVKGDILSSFKAHPYGLFVFIFVFLQIPYRLYLLITNKECFSLDKGVIKKLVNFIIIAFFILWLFRLFGYF